MVTFSKANAYWAKIYNNLSPHKLAEGKHMLATAMAIFLC